MDLSSLMMQWKDILKKWECNLEQNFYKNCTKKVRLNQLIILNKKFKKIWFRLFLLSCILIIWVIRQSLFRWFWVFLAFISESWRKKIQKRKWITCKKKFEIAWRLISKEKGIKKRLFNINLGSKTLKQDNLNGLVFAHTFLI